MLTGAMPVSRMTEIEALVRKGDLEALDALVKKDRRSVRHLVSLTYSPEARLRQPAARALAMAVQYHPKLMKSVVRRFVWAMNDESGTHAVSAPDVLTEIAGRHPEIVLPVVPDLVRLAGDESLREGLSRTLKIVASRYPGEVGRRLGKDLTRRLVTGGKK